MPHDTVAPQRDFGHEPTDERSPLLGTDTLIENAGSSAKPSGEEDVIPIAEELPLSRLALILLSTWTGVFLSAIDTTVITTLIAPISSSFSSFASISWIATGYLISNAAMQPLFGRLTDIYGRRSGLVVCNVLFGIGTLMCGVAQNEGMIVAGRVIAGAGGGGLTAISSIVATDLVPLRKRGIVQGGGNIAYGTGSALGGLFGGFISDRFGWRWAFLVQVPLILVSALMAIAFIRVPVKKTTEARHRRVDYAGSFTLITSLVLLLIALNTGGNIVPWNHPLVWTCLPLSGIFLTAFVYVEKRLAKEPVIPMDLLADRTVLAACLTNWFMVMSVFAIYFHIPLYFLLINPSATSAGLHLIPFALGISLGSVTSGIIMNRTGKYYKLGLFSIATFNLGVLLTTTLTLTTTTTSSPLYQSTTLLTFGFGYGSVLTTTLVALISAVPHSSQAVATSASYAFRATGSTIGATVGGAVFQNILKKRLYAALGHSTEAEKVIESVRGSFDEVARLPEVWKGRVVGCYLEALRAVFWVAVGFAVVAAVAASRMREHRLHGRLDRK